MFLLLPSTESVQAIMIRQKHGHQRVGHFPYISILITSKIFLSEKKGKRKVQGVPQSQTTALPRHQEEEKTDKSKQAQIEQKKRTKSTKIRSLFPKEGNRNAKRTEKHKNKMTQGKT